MATELTAEQGFDQNYYLQAKAAQLTTSTGTTWTAAQVLAAIDAAGLTVSEHYLQYGAAEGLEPNAYFNSTQYAISKAAEMGGGATPADFELAWYQASGSTNVYLHYIKYGAFEAGVSPSTGFDDQLYYAAKATQMGGGATPADAQAAIQAAGMNAISHYLLYGKNESLSYTPTPAPIVGQTFTLTTGVDVMTGSSTGNNVFNGVVDTAAAGGTLTPGDTLNGGGGLNNTANFVITTPATWAAGATLTGIQTINFRDVTGLGDTINTSNITGATAFNSIGGTAATLLTLSNIQANATLGMKSSVENLAATFVDGTFTTGGTLSLDLDAAGTKVNGVVTRPTITAGHVATAGTATDLTLAINAANSNYVTFTDGANKLGTYQTLTVTGQGSVNVNPAGTEFNSLTTVDASKNNGGLTVNLGANAKDMTITGGAGNDSFDLTGGTFDGNDTVNGGAGTDTLSITLANAIAFTKAANVTNIETLGLKLGGALAADATVNADYFGNTNVIITDALDGATNTLSLSNLVNDATVTFGASSAVSTATVVVDVKGAVAGLSDSVTLAFGKGVDYTTNAVTVKTNGVETVNIATATTAGAGAQLSKLDDGGLTTLNISGSDGIKIGTITGTSVTTIDASGVVKDSTGTVGGVTLSMLANTAAVTYTGGQGVDTYSASNKGDTITGGQGADIITLGTGNDKLVYNAANESTATVTDVIGGFDTASDLVQFNASLLVGSATWNGATAFTATGHTQLNMAGANLQIDYDGDAVIDSVITLTGVTSATFGSSNFTFA